KSRTHSLRLYPAAGDRPRGRLGSSASRQRRLSGRRARRGKTVAMNDEYARARGMPDGLLSATRRAARHEQFPEVVSAEQARTRFEKNLDLSPLPGEMVALAACRGRVLAHDVVADVDAPPFDRANVDGFALRAADTHGATDAAPRRLILNREVVACGHLPA